MFGTLTTPLLKRLLNYLPVGFRRRRRRKKDALPNRRVRNATPTTYKGINFKSKMEVGAYKVFEELEVPTEYEKKVYTIVPAFEYKSEKLRKNTAKPDFTGPGYILEVKGYPSDAFPLRWKLLKYVLATNPEYGYPDVYLCRNKGQILEAVHTIKKNLEKHGNTRKQIIRET